jgi:small GTP-binding protein
MIVDHDSSRFKVVLLGNSGAGKTSILDYALTNTPKVDPQPTIGCIASVLNIVLPSGPVQLRVWDTAGQELYRSIVPIYVRGAAAALLVYDVTDEKSIDALDHWHSVLMEEQSGDILIYVVANKIDQHGTVSDAQGEGIARKVNGSFHRVSAKTGDGINELFTTIAQETSTGERFQTNVVLEHAQNTGSTCC